MKKIIFHIDVNSAYLSWESVRRIRDGGEDLRLVPAAIGGDREKRTGVILAKSIPAKAFGIKTGESVVSALKKCPQLKLAKPDFSLYHKCSRAFVRILENYSPVVEQVSIDECFVDMSGMELIYDDIIATAYKIKDEIRDNLGFTVNVGIAENKLCAKMASDFEKPDKVHTLFPYEVEQKLWPLPIGELFSVGKATAEKLRKHGIFKIGELARCEESVIKSILGNKQGEQLLFYANGIDDSPVHEVPEDAKGYSISTTLEEDINTYEEADGIMLSLADSVATRMRRDGVKAYCISATVRTSEFVNRSHQRKLEASTDITTEIYHVANGLLRELWHENIPLRLLGISLTEIDRGDAVQLSFFGDENYREKERSLDKTVDDIRKKFGYDTIKRGGAVADVGKKFKDKK